MEYSVIILLLPLCMFLFLGLVGHKLSERVAGILGTIGLSVAAVLAYVVAFNYFTMPRNAEGVFDTLQPINFEWLRFTEHLHIIRPYFRDDAGCYHNRVVDGSYL